MKDPREGGSVPRRRHSVMLSLVAILVAVAAAAYAPSLNLPFIGDDYVFLDKTRAATFSQLWAFSNTAFGWWRPWSREFHFWLLQDLAGVHEVAFRSAGIAIWIAALCLYAGVVKRLASARAAGIATLGVAALALWGTPLLWISGSQDLWMILFVMGALHLFIAGRRGWALAPFALALLSKETSAVLPALLGLYVLIVERRSVSTAIRRTAHLWALVAIWLIAHPTIHKRLLDPSWRATPEVAHRPSELGILLKSLSSTVNLDIVPRPMEVDTVQIVRLFAVVTLLTLGAWLVVRNGAFRSSRERVATRRALLGFALAWVAVGWFPLFLPSIGWHAYYGCLGTMGAWFAIALWLQDYPRAAVASLGVLAALQWADANTMSWDWGNEWYQRRAGVFLKGIRESLLRQYPTLPPNSRIFFGNIPNNIGLVAGQSPAIRVWYRDSSLHAGFYSWYRPRATMDAPGPDYFFRFDSLQGLVEVKTGSEDVSLAVRRDPSWEASHEKLAMLFLRKGNTLAAAEEFEKLSRLPSRPDCALYAAVCWELTGSRVRADSLYSVAAQRGRIGPASLHAIAEQLKASVPTPSLQGSAEPRGPP